MFTLTDVKYKDIIDIPHMEIPTGITCIIGASGAGKTTLLKLLNKLYSPDEGLITYQGEDIKTMDSVLLRRKVIMLNQNPILYEGNIFDNLQQGLRFSNLPDASLSACQDILKLVRLDKHIQTSCLDLSGGEKQRLCLARVLLMDGDVYLLDEPSSALDSESESLLIEVLSNFVNKHHKSMIMVTHSMKAVNQLHAHKLQIIKGGCEVIE